MTTLVILAAGMGLRYKGNKQTDSIDLNGNFIIDYSIFDAILSKFDDIIIIIRKDMEKIFKNTIEKRLNKRIKIRYAFQETDDSIKKILPPQRIKPLGTAHAILCCKDMIKTPFMIINADDFYGRHSYHLAADFIKNVCDWKTYGCIVYEAGKTMTKNGSVKRGICQTENDDITNIIESNIFHDSQDTINAVPLDGGKSFTIDEKTPVSMNMFILSPSIFSTLESEFKIFLSNMTDPVSDEFLLPNVISKMIREKNVKLKMIKSDETWFGVTYPEDKQSVVDAIKNMVESEKYPENLWN